MRIFLTALAILCIQLGFSQKTDTPMNEKLLKEMGDKACKCVDSVQTFGRKSTEIAGEISECIDEQTGAYQIGSKISTIDLLKELEKGKDGKAAINISVNINKESDEYKSYYFQMERYVVANCASAKEKLAASDGQSARSLSDNKESLSMYWKGVEEAKQGNHQQAITYYEQALKIDSQFAFAWDNIGLSYRKLNDFDRALRAYQRSLEIDPNGVMPLQNIAVVYQYKKEYTKAIEAYQRLSKIDSDNPEIFYGIGNIYAFDLVDLEKGLANMCKAYNLYIEQKSPYRTDAEKIISSIYAEMKKAGKLDRFNEILKEHNIRTQ